MQKPSLFNDTITPWFKTKTFKLFVLVLAILSITTIVLFSEQIGNVLELLGIKATDDTRELLIDGVGGTGEAGHTSFLEGPPIMEPPESFTIDENNRLVLNPTN